MNRLVDKVFVLTAMLALAFAQGTPTAETIVALLVAIIATSLFELPSIRPWRLALPLVLLAAAAAAPSAALATLPVAAYDLARLRQAPLRAAWLVPIATALGNPSQAEMLPLCLVVSLLAFALSWRSSESLACDVELHSLRDDLQEKVNDLDSSRHELISAQDEREHAATLAERSRISREIHDNVGHLLTRSILQVEALEVVHDGDGRTVTELEGVATTLREALDTTRETVHAMADDALDLERDLRRAAETSGIASTDVTYDVDAPVPGDVARCVSAVVQEALTNAARHAHAPSARVHMTEYPAIWQIVITNDGDVPRQGPTAGMGLRVMRERVEALAGTLRITSDGNTLIVFASIPRKDAQ